MQAFTVIKIVNHISLVQNNQGCDIAYFYTRKRRVFMILDTIDISCLVY